MRFKMTVSKSINAYLESVAELRDANILGRALYEGAKIVADEVRSEIETIPDQSRGQSKRSGLSPEQRQGLRNGLGITRAQADGMTINVKIGMDGYNSKVTKGWPQGQPNAMIARSIEGGTQFLEAHPFIGPAVRKSRAAALKAMADTYDKEAAKIMGGRS